MFAPVLCPSCDHGIKRSLYIDPDRLNFIPGAGTTSVTHPQKDAVLRLVRAGRHIATMSRPVGMNKVSRTGQ